MEGDADPGHASRVEDYLARLSVLIANRTAEPSRLRTIKAYGSIAITLMLGFLSLISAQLGTGSAVNVGSLVLTLFFWLLCQCALCSIIAETLTSRLNGWNFASTKTFAKATTITLALSTLVVGVAFSSKLVISGQATVLVIALYVAILLASLSADNLVHHGEAQLHEASLLPGKQ